MTGLPIPVVLVIVDPIDSSIFYVRIPRNCCADFGWGVRIRQ